MTKWTKIHCIESLSPRINKQLYFYFGSGNAMEAPRCAAVLTTCAALRRTLRRVAHKITRYWRARRQNTRTQKESVIDIYDGCLLFSAWSTVRAELFYWQVSTRASASHPSFSSRQMSGNLSGTRSREYTLASSREHVS